MLLARRLLRRGVLCPNHQGLRQIAAFATCCKRRALPARRQIQQAVSRGSS